MKKLQKMNRHHMPCIFAGIIAILFSCSSDKALSTIEYELLKEAKKTMGFVWFKFDNSILDKSSGSGHPFPHLRVRFNTIAATRLDSTGRIKSNALFPEGSLIVKELMNAEGEIQRYAILKKQAANEFADERGWVWGYINADASIAVPSSEKGASCINCHSQSGNIDYMLMNKYFP